VWSQALDYVIDGDAHALSRCDPILRRTDALLLGACDDGGAGVVRARAWIALGPPAEPWMADAAGVEAAWSWWGRELDPWLARIVRRGETPLGELVAAAATGRISTHVISPLRGAYWRHLRETRGDEFVRGLWRGTRVLETGPVEHAAFTTWLAARTAAARIEHEGRREAARARDRDFKLLRGVAFSEFDDAHARIDARSSPGRILEPALDEAKQLGADAVLVTAHAVDRPGLEARFGDAPPSLVEPREGDVRVAAALLAASKRGMRTCLSANLLAGSGGTWSGTWTRGPESDWAGFFDRYSRFVEHHGALAELTGTTILSLGTALPDVATLAPPGRRPNHLDAGYKQAGWTRVIAVARRSFSGLLTYTAGSPAELDGVPFLADLDFVSLDMSPTLELDDPADGTEARYEITHLMDVSLLALEKKARETKKRILFTQVCFSPALEGAARRFGVEHASVDWQAQQFLDFSERLRTWSGLPLVAGVFAWRLGTGAAEPDYAPVLDSTRVREAVRTLYQGLPR
jgi:hypothetical protein